MARIYTAQFNGVALTAQVDLFEITAGAGGDLLIHEIGVSNLTEVGDAQEENLLLLLKQGQTAAGTGGTSPTKVPRDVDDTAANATVTANNTSKAASGTIVTHYAWNWNVRVPFQMIWTPETRPYVKVSRRCTLELATTPADSITIAGYLVWQEGD